MGIVGTWQVFLDFNCGSDFLRFEFTFNEDGTWTGFPNRGGAAQYFGSNGLFLFYQGRDPDQLPVMAFSGRTVGNTMVGTLSRFANGRQGCFYAIKEGEASTASSPESWLSSPW